jgi:hypothetical protein
VAFGTYILWLLVYLVAFGTYILWLLVHFVAFGIFSRFGTLYQEKSGNPGHDGHNELAPVSTAPRREKRKVLLLMTSARRFESFRKSGLSDTKEALGLRLRLSRREAHLTIFLRTSTILGRKSR